MHTLPTVMLPVTVLDFLKFDNNMSIGDIPYDFYTRFFVLWNMTPSNHMRITAHQVNTRPKSNSCKYFTCAHSAVPKSCDIQSMYQFAWRAPIDDAQQTSR